MIFNTFVFDFGQVIGRFDEYELAAHFAGDPEDVSLLKEVFYDRSHWDLLDRGVVSDDEVKEMFHRRLPVRLHGSIDKFYDNWITAVPVVDGMDVLIKDLKAAGAKLYLLSNISVQFSEHYADSPWLKELFGLFDGLVFSGPIKLVKPQPEIFEYLTKKYALTPGQCLFIDDNSANIEAGKKAGYQTYLFDGDSAALRRYVFGGKK